MVLSEIRAQYSDENDLLRSVIKRIWETWDAEQKSWKLIKVEYLFDDSELPVFSYTIEISVEHRHGWLIPPEWEFITEAWAYTRQPVDGERRGHTYDHDSEVEVIR